MNYATERVQEARLQRFRQYPEYKHSGIEWLGKIPKEWEVKPLSAAVIRNDSGVWGEDFDDDGTIVLRSTEQTMQGGWRIEEPARRRLSAREAAYAKLCVGDLLVTKSSGSPQHIGKTSIVDEEIAALNCCYSNFMQRLRISAGNVPQLFWHFMNCPVAREQLVFLSSTTTGLGNLNGSILGAIRVPMASPNEQRAISAFLDRETAKIDGLVARKERLIELLREKRAALITRAVTRGLDQNVPMKDSGIKWLGKIPAHWEIRRIAMAVNKITNGYVGPTRDILVDDGVRYLQSLHIKNGQIDFDRKRYFVTKNWSKQHRKSVLRTGDVLVVQTGDIGQNCVVPSTYEGANCHALIILRLKQHLGEGAFFSLLLQSSYGQNALKWSQTGALHPHLECGHVREIPVVLPPPEEQRLIIREVEVRLQAIDSLLARVRQAIHHLKEFRTALISAAVTGKIDVREEVS